MDQIISRILALDAETDENLEAAKLRCQKQLEEARQQAAAYTEANEHDIRDKILELEEQTRETFEQKNAALQKDFDRRAEALQQQFEENRQTLLEALFTGTLKEAEA